MYHAISIQRYNAMCLIVLPLAVGCFGGDPTIGAVSGTVTLDGKPVPEAQVYFKPVSGGRSSFSMTDAEGNYELRYTAREMGALIGDHHVRLSSFQEAMRDDDGSMQSPGRKELFPPDYSSEPGQTVTVTAGQNTIDFDISS